MEVGQGGNACGENSKMACVSHVLRMHSNLLVPSCKHVCLHIHVYKIEVTIPLANNWSDHSAGRTQ